MDSACRADFALDPVDMEEPVEANGALREIRLGVDPRGVDCDRLSSDPLIVPDQAPPSKGFRVRARGASVMGKLGEVRKELWWVLSLLAVAVLMNCMIPGQRLLLGLYSLPILFSAYFYGRHHATLPRSCRRLPDGSPCPYLPQALPRHGRNPDRPGPLA